jgi:DNA invertase Pin-like site-specific DNA recombinase
VNVATGLILVPFFRVSVFAAQGRRPSRPTFRGVCRGARQSGASAADREGFQRLVAEVSMGRAGIVLGLEVSRLARNNADWHRLLQICALSATLICDEDGLYDPTEFNDRLLLGLKGTMSEAELHFIRARLIGGQLSKARRGELQMPLPVGLVYDPTGKVVLDPDTGVQQAVRHVFTLFARTGSARATVQQFNADGVLFRCGCAPAPARASWRGCRCGTGECCAPCTTRATPARSPMAAAANASPPTAKRPSRPCRASSGSR